MKKTLTHNLGLKLIALMLAIITWIYVNGELKKMGRQKSPLSASES